MVLGIVLSFPIQQPNNSFQRWAWRHVDHSPNEIYASGMKVRDVLKLLKDDGWYLVVTEGSHRQFKYPTKKGRVTVPGKPNDDLPIGTLNSVLRQAGLKS